MILDKQISFPSHIMLQEFDDEAILLDLHTQEHFGLDPVASMFLMQIQNSASTREAYNSILESYDVSAEQLESDLSALIDSLLQHKLIEIS